MDREWTPPSSQTRAYYSVGLRLRDGGPARASWSDVTAFRKATAHLSDVDVARRYSPGEAPTDEDWQQLQICLVARAVGERRLALRWTRRVTAEELLEGWDALSAALTERAQERARRDVALEVGRAFVQQRRVERAAMFASSAVLVAAEALAVVGLISPGSGYWALMTAVLVSSTVGVVSVLVDAGRSLLRREPDVQSPGLDWSDEPVGSHWETL